MREAIERVSAFTSRYDFATLVWLYALITSHENHMAVKHYQPIPERDFVAGVKHRPVSFGTGSRPSSNSQRNAGLGRRRATSTTGGGPVPV